MDECMEVTQRGTKSNLRRGFSSAICVGLLGLGALSCRSAKESTVDQWSYQGCKDRWCQIYSPYPLEPLKTKVEIRGATVLEGWQYISRDRVLENVVWSGSTKLTKEQFDRMLGGFMDKMRADTGKSVKVVGYEVDGAIGRLAFRTLGTGKNTAGSITIVTNGSQCASLWLAWDVSDQKFALDAFKMQQAFRENSRLAER
jgi:hypothetical protein